MQANRIVRLLIAICISAAFLSAQMAPSFAAKVVFAVADDQMHDMQMQMGADDDPCPAPCCPDGSAPHDCGHCPLGICVPLSTIAGPLANAALVHRYPSRSAFAVPVDQFVDGIDLRPPDHPPRTLV
jgi:hypothetical protein